MKIALSLLLVGPILLAQQAGTHPMRTLPLRKPRLATIFKTSSIFNAMDPVLEERAAARLAAGVAHWLHADQGLKARPSARLGMSIP